MLEEVVEPEEGEEEGDTGEEEMDLHLAKVRSLGLGLAQGTLVASTVANTVPREAVIRAATWWKHQQCFHTGDKNTMASTAGMCTKSHRKVNNTVVCLLCRVFALSGPIFRKHYKHTCKVEKP